VILAALVLAMQFPAVAPLPDSAHQMPAIVRQAQLDTSVINFRALVFPETVYVGQQATYQLGIFVDERVRDRVRHLEATAPEMRTMLAYDAPPPVSGLPLRSVGSREYEVHVYQRAIFPLAPGRLAIPPAHLSYAMPLSFSFFSREENFELRSDSAVVVAIEPPRAARPPDYTGAVGRLRAAARLDGRAARVGEPMTLTVRISGVGNVKLLPRPRVSIPWASLVPAGERVSLSSDPIVIRGSKEFDWVVTPLTSGRVTLPRIRYPYFNPVQERYEVAETAPDSLMIAAGRLATLDTADRRATPRWTVRTGYRGALAVPPYTQPPFWVLLALAPLPAAVLLVARRPRRRKERARSPAQALHALARRDDTRAGVREVRALFLRAVAGRIHTSSVMLGEPRVLERALRRAGTSRDTAVAAARLVEELNSAAFGTQPAALHDAAQRGDQLFRAIDAEARFRRVPHVLGLVLLVCMLGVASAWALSAPSAESARFDRGVDAYVHGRYREAARDFAWITARVPRAADAWANLGTAAWAAGDSAHAALGWERALRLEPLARDARERLDQVMPVTSTGPGAVPLLPPVPMALLAVVLWCGGWGWLAVRLRQGRRGAALPLGLAGVAVVLGLAAAVVDARLAARGLNVVAADGSLHVLPVMSAEQSGAVRMGEVTRVVERRGAWARVAAGSGGDGWIDATLLLPLDRD
jgi:hypothetical protein